VSFLAAIVSVILHVGILFMTNQFRNMNIVTLTE